MAILLTISAVARAQVVPATTGPEWPPVGGTLSYGLSYSQMALFYGGLGGNSVTSTLSGELTYANTNHRRPFSLTYAGGDSWTLTGASAPGGYFQHLAASQGMLGRNWSLLLSDNVALMPEAPVGGFSGIPGIGTLPAQPGPTDQPILTLNTRSIDNTTSASFSRNLDALTGLGFSTSYGMLRFPNGDGLASNQLQLGPQITRRLNALSSLSAQYAFSRFTYPQYSISMSTQSMLFSYQRKWSRRLSTSVSAGPQWVLASSSAGLPASTDLSMSASASYGARRWTASLNFSRGATGGGGDLTAYGATNDNLSADYSRRFGKNLSLSTMATYMRTQGLQLAGAPQAAAVTSSEEVGVSASRKLGRYFNASADYTAIRQSSSTALSANAISGLAQTISFSIGYSPRAIHFRK